MNNKPIRFRVIHYDHGDWLILEWPDGASTEFSMLPDEDAAQAVARRLRYERAEIERHRRSIARFEAAAAEIERQYPTAPTADTPSPAPTLASVDAAITANFRSTP